MKFVFVLLVAIYCNLSVGQSEVQCSCSVECHIQAGEQPCTNCCKRFITSNLDTCSWNSGEVCVINVTGIQRNSCSLVRAPSCLTTTTVITQYLSITPTNCLQSTHTKEMSTTVETRNCDTATGEAICNDSLVILGAFIAVLAALLVAVTTGWIVTCVVNRRKDKASTTSNKNNALQNPAYDSEHVQRYQGNPSSRTHTGYSSEGPAYEQVRVDTATNYDVIDRSGPRPQTTHPDQDYSTLDTDEQEHDYHVLESTNAGGPTAVVGQEPQDYEIPLRKM